MAHSLEDVIRWVRAKNRPGQFDGILLTHIDRLTAELDEAVAMVNEMDSKDLELVSGAEINRIEIIDQTGRFFVAHETLSDVKLSFQDEGRTLKVFCHRRADDPRTAALDALVAQAQEMGEYPLTNPVAPVQATLRASDASAAPSAAPGASCACGAFTACRCGVVG